MANYNKVILLGNLTREPQLRYIPNTQTAVTELGLAVNRRWRTPNGEDREETCFIDCVAYGKQAEIINQYCRKGSPLLVEGRLKLDTWEDKQGGGKRSKHRVVVENFQLLGSPAGAGQGQRPAAPAAGRAAPADQPPPAEEPPPIVEEQRFKDDDIPF